MANAASCAVVDARIITLDIRTGPTTWKPGDFEMPPEKGSKGVVVQVPGKAALVRGILESSDDEEGGGEELVAPCPQCGRTYPHVHVRAARAGGVGRDWSDDDSGEDDG